VPIESTPTLARVPDSTPVRSAVPGPADALTLGTVAPSQVVDPLLRAARGRLAALQLEARAAERAADEAEAALSTDADPVSPGSVASRGARSAELDAELEDRRRHRDLRVAAARREAADLVADARLEAEAVIAAARAELDRSLRGRPGASPEPAPAPVPPTTPAPSYPPPAASIPVPPAAPTTAPPPAPAAPPAPTATAPPMAASPLAGAVSYSTVLVQAPDGTFQQAIVMTPGPSPVVPGSPMLTSTFTSSVPGPAVGAPSPSSRPAARRLLHLDVVLPLLAVLIVLVVLLAWLG
jgi:hypothetical protein